MIAKRQLLLCLRAENNNFDKIMDSQNAITRMPTEHQSDIQ